MSRNLKAKYLSREFFGILVQQKQIEQRLTQLCEDADQFRSDLGASFEEGNQTMSALANARESAGATVETMEGACASARAEVEPFGTPFECPSARMQRLAESVVQGSRA